MYNFIDTTEVSEVATLPSEALQINGQYIENLIQGYRTLTVSGREALSAELDYFETGVRDGSKFRSKRYPARIITVAYQLIAESSEAFRESYNQLASILNVEDAVLIFNDEPDKFFVGTPEAIGTVSPGQNTVTGEFEILCLDPFKYSVIEYEATGSVEDKSVLIDYNGTYNSFPVLEADFYDEAEDGENEKVLTGNGDCGYVAFFNEREKIVQLGDPSEVDGEETNPNQTLINQTFLSDTSWGTTAKKLWALNSGGVQMQASTATPSTITTTLLKDKASTASSPTIIYTVSAKAHSRAETSVKVDVTITTKLKNSSNYFGNGLGLKGSVYISNAWHDVTIKSTSEYWKGNSGHTVNLSFTVTGLSSGSSSLVAKFKVTRTDNNGKAGTLGETVCTQLSIPTYAPEQVQGYYLTASNYGSGTGWHGARITRQIGADSAGEVGATHFHFYGSMVFGLGKQTTTGYEMLQRIGAFECKMLDANGNNVASVRVVKTATGRTGKLNFYLNGEKVNSTELDIPGGTPIMKNFYIRKNGSNVQFNFNSYTRHYTVQEIENIAVTQVSCSFEQYGTNAPMVVGLREAKFTKYNCNTWNDTPNKFAANDIVEADCKEGKVYLNGIETAELGALGNDWEGFYLTPGLNQIGFAYSEWLSDEYAPTIKVRYREVFL